MDVHDLARRASNGDRESIAARLKEAFTNGLLDLPDFQWRMDRVYAAVTLGDLAPIIADLPARISRSGPDPVPDGARRTMRVLARRSRSLGG
ncbi:MAG: DUF1707 SHOCT-like domain-containing protein [Streptosporangiaceae bacterium]